LSLAGFSLNLYILVLYDGSDTASREASLKYFYLSTLSAGFILFGVLLIYIIVGDVTYYAIRFHMSAPIDAYARKVMSIGVLFILLGFFFKLSAFPGHLWAVEVYEGSPLPIMAFFILPVKVAVFITFLRLLNTGFFDFSHIWLPCVTFAALGSLVWGALAATASRKTTRYLGYASITQMGFLLLGLVTDTDDGVRSAFFYLVIYAIMTGGFLLIFTHIRKSEGQTLLALSDFRGLGKSEPRLCWHLSVFLFSMAGIPPLAGFLGKYYLLAALMDRGLFVPIIVALIVSLIATYYYLRIIKTLWFEESIAIKPLVVLLSNNQRTLLCVLEAFLWAAALFAPALLPALTDVTSGLMVCADVFAQTFYSNSSFTCSAQALCALSPDLEFINALVEQDRVANLRYGVLFLLALSSLGVYSIILAGWSSNSKYAFIGALRSAAQMISYEVAISLIILPVVVFSGSLNLSMITYVQHITSWLLWPLLPVALLFLVAMLAETNRTPFDLPEAEAELVAGYNVDYSSLPFAMFFLGEYCNMILISTLYCLLFLSGGLNSVGLSSALILSAKASVTWVFFVLVRATLPRYRYDQLMDIGWKVFLPVSGSFLLFAFGILVFFSALPVANELPLRFRLAALID
jgi:proton-translocating NADH-quinone oxidoreductase chain N